jgi:hypothetical protein
MFCLLILLSLACKGPETQDTDSDTDQVCDLEEYPQCGEWDLIECAEDGSTSSTPCDFGCNTDRFECNSCDVGVTECLTSTSLQVCSSDGLVESTTTCDFACNTARLECNDCIPDDVYCKIDELVTCGSGGEVATTRTCDFGCTDSDGYGGTEGSCIPECTEHSECDDSNNCTVDRCDPDPLTSELTCFNTVDTTIEPDDGIGCTIDWCDGDVETHTDDNSACNDGFSCSSNACDPLDVVADPSTGCVNTYDHTICEDDYSCTVGDICGPSDANAQTNGCVPPTPDNQACDDSVDCTIDTCVGSQGDSEGCANTPDDALCLNDDVCLPLDDCTPYPTISSVEPSSALNSAPAELTVAGLDFTTDAEVNIAGVVALTSDCDYSGVPTRIVCDFALGTSPVLGDVEVVNNNGLDAQLEDSFTWTAVVDDADFCTVQDPRDLTSQVGIATDYYGQLYLSGQTDVYAKAVTDVAGQLGISGKNATGDDLDPTLSNSWTYSEATPNPSWDFGQNNDEYVVEYTPDAQGVYQYVFRFSLDDGLNWTYCDQDDTTGFDSTNTGTLTVFP